MIEPPPASRMAGTHALQHCQTPRTLTAMVLSHSSWAILSKRPPWMSP